MSVILHKLRVHSPNSLKEALEILHEKRDKVKVLAGGTDLIVQIRSEVLKPSEILNIYGLDELRYIEVEGERLRIGALTTYRDIILSRKVAKAAPILVEASKLVGSPQIQSKGTIGGNICNASPAADSLPPLYVLKANLVLQSLNGRREIPIEKFYKGYKKMDMRPDELLVEVNMPIVKDDEDAVFMKHGLRLGDAISVVNAAIWVKWGNGFIEDARIALGAVAPVIVRGVDSEAYLRGKKLDEDTIWKAAEMVLRNISPITDVRGTAEYRRELAVNLVFMGLWELAYRGDVK